jgi:FKBP-type peptidyl-prolyl cis-trans isomerase FklB
MQKFLTTALLLATGTILTGDGFAQQTPAANSPAATTQAAPSATTSKSSSTAKTPVKKTGTATKAGAPSKAGAATPLTTRTQKYSYALGMDIGSKVGPSLKKQSVEFDPALVSQGLKDAMSGGKTRLTEQEAQAVLTEVQTAVNKERQEKMQKAATTNKAEGEAFLAANKTKPGVVTLPSGLQYKILKEGTGPKPTAADTVSCNYRGTLINGTEFDSSEKHGGPAKFAVGQVIKGWTEALQLMPVGSKWQLFVPSNLAYGERGAGGDIGPETTLIFDVELVSIEKPADDKAKEEKKDDTTNKKDDKTDKKDDKSQDKQ